MAEGDGKAASQSSQESDKKIVKVSPEDYSVNTKDFTSIKVICLGDTAVGKSKWVILNKAHPNTNAFLICAG